MKIAILKSWEGPSLEGQWPRTPPPEYQHLKFQYDTAEGADYVVLLNGVREDTVVHCQADRLWALVQEPPTPQHRFLHKNQAAIGRIYTTSEDLLDERHHPFWGAVQWHIGLGIDELEQRSYPAKSIDLSWITSRLSHLEGQKRRLRFLQNAQNNGLEIELRGRGFQKIERKWDLISQSRYSIAFENTVNNLYWSEKLSDVLLGFSTPIYFGCSSIEKYFPRGAIIRMDDEDPMVFDRIKDIVSSTYHEDTKDLLLEARDMCLRKYNTLFFIAGEVLRDASAPALIQPEIKVLAQRKMRPLKLRVFETADALVTRLKGVVGRLSRLLRSKP